MNDIESPSRKIQPEKSQSSLVITQGHQLEYPALRNEILKRIELRHQIVQTLMVFAGIVFGLGLNNPTVALVFPPVAALFALSWVQSDYRIRDIATYIREYIETEFEKPGWETALHERRHRKETEQRYRGWRLVVFSHGGLFVGTQLISIFIGLTKYNNTPTEIFLLVISVFSVVYVTYIVSKSPSRSDSIFFRLGITLVSESKRYT